MEPDKKDIRTKKEHGTPKAAKIPKTSWEHVAGWYDEHLEQSSDSYQEKVILPNLIRIVNPEPDMTIIDNACGQGYFSRAFSEKGARVIGCDISPELIARARLHSSRAGNPSYFVAPADHFFSQLSYQKSQLQKDPSSKISADIITIILALQNIEDISGVFAECARALSPNGKIIFVLNHPAFRIPHHSSWEWDEKNAVQYRRIDRYMSDDRITIDMKPGEANISKKEFTVSFHRPLQSYVKALSKAGFAITRLEEWISHRKSAPGSRAVQEDRIRKEIPLFICIEAQKRAQ